MGRSELLLVFGALLIFSIFTLTIFEVQIQNRIQNINRKYEDKAISLIESYINMALSEKFDHNTDQEDKLPNGNTFTQPNMLGPELAVGETEFKFYDDFDDYEGLKGSTLYTKIPGKNDSIGFFVQNAEVSYVDNNHNIVNHITKRKTIKFVLQNNNLRYDSLEYIPDPLPTKNYLY